MRLKCEVHTMIAEREVVERLRALQQTIANKDSDGAWKTLSLTAERLLRGDATWDHRMRHRHGEVDIVRKADEGTRHKTTVQERHLLNVRNMRIHYGMGNPCPMLYKNLLASYRTCECWECKEHTAWKVKSHDQTEGCCGLCDGGLS